MTKTLTPGSYYVTITTTSTVLVRDLTQEEIEAKGKTDYDLLEWAINEDEELISRDSMEILDWHKES